MQPLLQYNPPQDPLRILFEDDDVIVIDKPSGLLSVPGKDARHQDCVELRLKAIRSAARLVHRLDMDTSGVMIFAANPVAQRHLGLQFERRHLSKTYEALVFGQMDGDAGEVDLPLIVDWPNRPLQKVCHETGKSALTAWEVIGHAAGASRLRLYPKTGRSHQLRVHMKEFGHPILGDRFYASGEALEASERLCLHSRELMFRHPSGGAETVVTSPVPF